MDFTPAAVGEAVIGDRFKECKNVHQALIHAESGYACLHDKMEQHPVRKRVNISDVRHRWHPGA
jgi:hypothetical protein